MTAVRLSFLFLVLLDAASPAALVRVPDPPPLPPLSFAALEPNLGQALPEILFLHRGWDGVAVTANAAIFGVLGVRQELVGAKPDGTPQFLDPLPGIVNSLSGGNPTRWHVGLPRYGSALLEDVYPGVDIRYETDAEGRLIQRLLLDPGVAPETVVFEVPRSHELAVQSDGRLRVELAHRTKPPGPRLSLSAPTAVQPTTSGPIALQATFRPLSSTSYTIDVDGRNGLFPLEIALPLSGASYHFGLRDSSQQVLHEDGATFVLATLADAPGKPAPFPEMGWAACAVDLYSPFPCTDVVLYKVSANGDLLFATYLEGRTNEDAIFLDLAPDGSVIVAGNTGSGDFPTTPAALQPDYAGPSRVEWRTDLSRNVAGDFFAARLDPTTGELLGATFLGGPGNDQMSGADLGPDGSLYFLYKQYGRKIGGMPTSPTALMADCSGDCLNGYAARLSPALDRLLYGTYLPGAIEATAALHSDGSLYYGGRGEAGFPTSPTAYQHELAGGIDAIVARLDPQGEQLLFATYLGGPDTDRISRVAVALDGSVWAAVSSSAGPFTETKNRLVRFDSNGEHLLADVPISVGDMQVGPDGNLRATAWGDFVISPDAFLAHTCQSPAYIELSPTGVQLFASYLPDRTSQYFGGTDDDGLPLLVRGGQYKVVREQPPGIFAGCVVDAANFWVDALTPGQIVTLFGSGLGPEQGAAFELENGQLPSSLAGSRVLINGTPAPVLFASYWQINAILPYSLLVRSSPDIVVEYGGSTSESLSTYIEYRSAIKLFRRNESADRPAAALNEDGTANTASNPATPGSAVALFGTGGGATAPPSEAGEVTPLELRGLEQAPKVHLLVQDGPELPVEFAGAAPGLVAGVVQLNIRLPEEIPVIPGFAPGLLPLWVETPDYSRTSGWVTIAVDVN